jgi:hypothetical protein
VNITEVHYIYVSKQNNETHQKTVKKEGGGDRMLRKE